MPLKYLSDFKSSLGSFSIYFKLLFCNGEFPSSAFSYGSSPFCWSLFISFEKLVFIVGIVGLPMILLSLLARLSSSSLISFDFWCFKFAPSSDELSFIFPETFGPITFTLLTLTLETLRETTHDTVFVSGTDALPELHYNTFISSRSMREAREEELLPDPLLLRNFFFVLCVFLSFCFIFGVIDTSPCMFIASAKLGLLGWPSAFLNDPALVSCDSFVFPIYSVYCSLSFCGLWPAGG